MSSTFTGFSEEDLERIKSSDSVSKNAPQINTSNIKKLDRIGAKPKRLTNQYKLPFLQQQSSDENIENLFDKCKLSLKSPTSPTVNSMNNNNDDIEENVNEPGVPDTLNDNEDNEDLARNLEELENVDIASVNADSGIENTETMNTTVDSRKSSITMENSRRKSSSFTPDIVRCIDNYTEDQLAAHTAKLAHLQLQQKLMEEQNKKRKEMLAKAIADRTRQTTEEVVKLEKIKKELQVLDGQFSQDVAVLRKKIDHACLSYAEAEKHYLRVEKEFLQTKINLQKEKEKKELLTEHLCALITHNETRKAQKLETLMLELATDKKTKIGNATVADDDDKPIIVDGVDQRTGKIVEFTES